MFTLVEILLLSERTKNVWRQFKMSYKNDIQDVIELYNSVHEKQLNTVNETPYVMKDEVFNLKTSVWLPIKQGKK